MTVYNITLSDGVTVVSIADGSIDVTSADIPLVGQNSQLYGDDIAKALLFMLENFANSTPPSINPLVGQLWYDNVNNNLNVFSGVSFDPMAPVAQGTVQNSILRFDGTDTWLEETQVQISSSGVLSVFDVGLTNSVTIAHDGTWLNFDIGAGTTDAVRIRNTDLFIMDGGRLSWMPGGPQQFEICHDGTDVNFQFVGGGELLITQPTNVRINSVIALQDKGSAPADVPGYGQLWVRNDTPNILVFTDDTGTDFDLNAVGGAADHGTLSGLGDDDHPQYAEIGNTEPITGIWSFASRPNFNNAGAPFTVINTTVVTNLNADLLDGLNASSFALVGNTVNLTGAQSPIAGVKTFDDSVIADIGGSGGNLGVTRVGFKIEGTTGNTQSLTEGFFSLYFQNGTQEFGRFGSLGGDNDIEVRAVLGNLDLYAQNSLRMTLAGSGTSSIFNSASTAMDFRLPTSTNQTTSAAVYDTGVVARNVGYNETPEIIVSGNPTVQDVVWIGKFLRKSGTGTVTVRVDATTQTPIGASFMVHNDNASGSLTITTSGVTLQWVDGSGVAPLTGDRTIANNGVVTLRKKTSIIWQIWGNGIS